MKRIKKKFHEACANYGMLADGDRVLVALSGGKDSLMLARLMGEQARILKPKIEVEAAHVIMDNIAYESDLTFLETFCHRYGIRLNTVHTSFDESTDKRKTKCFLCSWYRRKALFRYAEEHGFNKLALGHHQDDILTTWLMNMTFVGANDTMRPVVAMRHYALNIIRPLCLVREAWIAQVAEEDGYEKQKTPCPYETASRRDDMGKILHELERINPEATQSLWRAMNGEGKQ